MELRSTRLREKNENEGPDAKKACFQANQLKTENHSLRTEVNQFKTENQLKAEIHSLRTEVNQFKTEVNQLKTENHSLRTEVNHEVNQLETENHSLRTEVNQFKTEVNHLKTENHNLRTDIMVLVETKFDKIQQKLRRDLTCLAKLFNC